MSFFHCVCGWGGGLFFQKTLIWNYSNSVKNKQQFIFGFCVEIMTTEA
jgi:hypothetical protein